MLKKQSILNVSVTAESKENVLKYVVQHIAEGRKKLFIITPNPEILVYANSHLSYQNKLNSADVSLPDGIGLLIAGMILGKTIPTRVTGVDFIEELCKVSREKPLSIGFLGGRGNVAELASECLKSKYPWMNIVFTGEEWDEKEISKYKDDGKLRIEDSALKIDDRGLKYIDILFVAFGAPKQEEWIYENLEKLPVRAAMGVGGAFDFLSGNVKRAPRWMRAVGMEWLFRLITQPWRIRRQLSLITFIGLVLKERTTK